MADFNIRARQAWGIAAESGRLKTGFDFPTQKLELQKMVDNAAGSGFVHHMERVSRCI